MRLLFISTNVNTYHNCELFPIGVGILAAYLKQFDHEIRVFTANRTEQFSELRAVLVEFKPDLVGYSVITPQCPNIQPLAAISKECCPLVPFLCGGAHPTLSPEDVIADPNVDIVCVGDGEISLKEYIESLERGETRTDIPGFWFKQKDGSIIRNAPRPFFQDLDSIPYMDRDLVDFPALLKSNLGTLWMLASRGCKWNCGFCGVPRIRDKATGEYLRIRSVDHVLGEIRECSKKYSFNTVAFRDDTFSWNREWTLEFCEKYAAEFKYPLMCLTRADTIDEEVAAAMAKANFRDVWIGYESGNDHIRNDVINKDIKTEQFLAACEMLARNGVPVCTLNIVGTPGETPGMFQQTIDVNRRFYSKYPVFAIASGSAPKIFTFEPFPGTPLHDVCARNGWLRKEQLKLGFRTHVDSYVNIPTFPRKKVLREYRMFRYKVYRGHHNALALFYLAYDSRAAEIARMILPTKAIFKVLSFFMEKAGFKRKVVHFDVRDI